MEMMEKRGDSVCLSFHDVGYHVKVKSRCAESRKQIIKEISGIFKPGMNAILGPTGSGKTTFLDILAGRKDMDGVNGIVLIDGRPQPPNFKCLSGYVVQENLLIGTLTVRECIEFSANLRISKCTAAEKRDRVDEILRELSLTKCADSKIGNEFVRGVSGGEAKRTSIGMELIISPSVIFLDEPTTGLDANTATSVMELLNQLSKKGKTIIFSIHQPRYSIFKTFDNILLMADGQTVYHGPANATLDYFKQFGYICEAHNNPPDFFLDVINSASQGTTHAIDNAAYENECRNGVTCDTIEERNDVSLHTKFTSSEMYSSLKLELASSHEVNDNQTMFNSNQQNGGYANGFFTQLKYVSKRTIINLIRNPQAVAMQIIITCIFAFIVGVIYFQIGTGMESGLQNRIGALFFIAMNQVFGNLSSIELFIQERKIFMNESASGYYRVSAYFFAKVFCDLIPLRILPITLFSIISYFMIGFQMEADKFFIYYLGLILISLGGSSLGFFISSSVNLFVVANLLTAMSFVLMMLFGGFLVNLKTMPSWLSWLQYLSIIRYALNMLTINELHDLVLYDESNGSQIPIPDVGKKYLDAQGIKYETLWDFWQNPLAMFLMIVLFIALSYIQLRRTPKYK